ncbi:MAG TPA: kelch repeat-containing protein, partial [Gemmatimonadales bacterium]|nr:kelch repeat-containing protein [Gemmatimonadales bacterium]
PELAVASNSWLIRAKMPVNRTNMAVATVTNAAGQSVVYVIGGLTTTGMPSEKVMAYNVATNTWTFRSPLPVRLAGSSGAGVINGKIYVSGGYSDYGGSFPGPKLYRYDPATNTWTQKRSIPILPTDIGGDRAAGNGVTGVIGGKLYVVSGCFQADDPWGYFETCNPLFFRYNPATDQWARLPNPFADSEWGAAGPSIGGVIAGKFYVMTGSRYTHDARMAVYDPATNRWTPQNPLGLGRPGAASAVSGGKLYVFGGARYNASKDAMEVLAITIRFDPTTGIWTRRADLPSPREHIAASKVSVNGQERIEVLGGIGTGNNLQYIP